MLRARGSSNAMLRLGESSYRLLTVLRLVARDRDEPMSTEWAVVTHWHVRWPYEVGTDTAWNRAGDSSKPQRLMS